MLNIEQEIIEYCKKLRTPAIRKNYKEQSKDNISFEEYIYNLLKIECESREENAKQEKLRLANFPERKYIEDLETKELPEDGRKKLKTFLTLEFIQAGQNIILAGSTGTRKNSYSNRIRCKSLFSWI